MVRNFLKKAFLHASDFWNDLGFVNNEEITVSGLGSEEKAFKESIVEECVKALAKFRKEMKEVRKVAIHVKSFHKGKVKMYEMKGSLNVGGSILHASASGRELYDVLKQVFAELNASTRKMKSLKDTLHKHDRVGV